MYLKILINLKKRNGYIIIIILIIILIILIIIILSITLFGINPNVPLRPGYFYLHVDINFVTI